MGKTPTQAPRTYPITKIIDSRDERYQPYNTAPITLEELRTIIKKLKRHNTPGPDEIPTEALKEMNDNNLSIILDIINEWWEQEQIPDEAMNARVVLIYKEGDTSLC